ncbi:F-box/RNI-like/FBD-like domains-containing protein [Rhynchospora pubera]|uniref:F-box/RNI-like/FBD-like domains-containing protein n=1 Tax=Rhynchospora pubera TaxID=906938 RepID=A0AAV8FFQ0_9POAL|nr:F-box/RNI-like/FBD-like domains-containing protein [Rhynchospora pubera]
MKRAVKSGRDKRDRISFLPDCLIHLIMSFLTAQEAVRTCLLSKRWKNLWTTLPFLDFDLKKFEYNGVPERRFDMFVSFVNTTLLLCEASDLHMFRLVELRDFKLYHMFVKSWIRYALKHNIKELTIELPLYYSSVPLDGVFNCASLINVSINELSNIIFETRLVTGVNLPCLKQLYLRGIELIQYFVDNLFSGCPVLEYLHLEDCGLGFSTMYSQSLKYLKIDCHEGLHYDPEEQMELIEAPNLLSFCYDQRSYQMGDKLHLKMPSLTSAVILCDEKLQGCTGKRSAELPRVFKFEGLFSGIFQLLLSVTSFQFTCFFFESLPTFGEAFTSISWLLLQPRG